MTQLRTARAQASAKGAGARGRWISILDGIRPYQRSWLRGDIVAGITLAALAIPEVMGYTKIAGMPVITGLYTVLIPIAAFALFGSSRHLVVGAELGHGRDHVRRDRSLGIAGPAGDPAVGRPAGLSALLRGRAAWLARGPPRLLATSSHGPCWSAPDRRRHQGARPGGRHAGIPSRAPGCVLQRRPIGSSDAGHVGQASWPTVLVSASVLAA